MHTYVNLFGEEVTVYSEEEWTEKYVDYCNKIYEERGSLTGKYCCGFHWCCDKCRAELRNGCADCVETIKSIIKKLGYEVDYSDVIFEKLEERIKKLYEQTSQRR